MNILKNNTTACEWIEGFPLGNGRLAAMVWDKNNADVISLNHEWLWRGVYKNQNCADAYEHLNEVRDAFKTGSCALGTKKAVELMATRDKGKDTVVKVDSYQPAGDICFKFGKKHEFISRELNIQSAVATVKRKGITAEFYTDCIKDVAVCKWIGEKPFGGELLFSRVEDNDAAVKYNIKKNSIEFFCQLNGGTSFCVKVYCTSDGNLTPIDGGFLLTDATYLYTVTDIGTSVYGIKKELKKKSYDFIIDKEAHCQKFKSFMDRVSLKLSGTNDTGFYSPAVEIEKIKNGKKDNRTAIVFFDYARYLMISCSLCASLPANLQGKWNRDINPPWCCDYHFDINLQMNYWMCEALNMSDFAEPLADYLVRIGKNSEKHARIRYGCKGMVMPLSDSAWAEGLPISFEYGFWVGAAAWMAQHLWWHYTYTNNTDFLREKAYPYFKSAAEFYEDFLLEDENGILQFIPSQSPENRFVGGGDYDVSLCVSSSNDVQLCYDLMNYAIKSAEILCADRDKISIWKAILSRLPEFKIGKDGRLLEWNEEKEEVEPGHKHLSHIYGIYPGDIFFDEKYKNQYVAAKKSFDYRISHGGGYTGWSRAWVACMYARFGDGSEFYKHLNHLMSDFVTTSLLDLHPPRIFQIDGNFGAAAAITEAIVSVASGKVYLVRALPKEWESGSLCGVKLPGGHTIDVYWENGSIKKAHITFGFENDIVIVANGVEKTFTKTQNGKMSFEF